MKPNFDHLESFRVRVGAMASKTKDHFGAFVIDLYELGVTVMCIVDDGNDPDAANLPRWEHVSVHSREIKTGVSRIPLWDEMQAVKQLFWEEEECVVQFHPPKSLYVNCHPHVLHMWRPLFINIPTPPREFIA